MKNKLLNFQGVSLSVSFDREKAEPIVENISKGCNNEANTQDSDELINSLIQMSESDKSHFLDKIDTSLTGEYIIEQEHLIDGEIWDDYKELQNIMRLMYAYDALQSGDTDLVKSAVKKLLYYFNSEFQREGSDKLLDDYIEGMSEEEMQKYLQDFLTNNIETSTFFSGILAAKKQEESNKKQSSSSGGGYKGRYAQITTTKAITSEDKKQQAQQEVKNVKTVEQKKLDEVLESEDSKKYIEEQTNQTKKVENIKNDFLNNSTEDKKENKLENNLIESLKNKSTSSSGKSLANSMSGLAESGIETVKDLIASGGKLKEEINGKLSSSISSIANKGMETIKPLVATASESIGNSSAVIPGVAGLSTAAVAGLGTKVYIDKKNDKEREETTNFFEDINEKEEEEKEQEEIALSKEDLVKALENKI